ncbi:MAG: hypothetical protein ACOYKZ_05390 [Chlamydiia bacterium]
MSFQSSGLSSSGRYSPIQPPEPFSDGTTTFTTPSSRWKRWFFKSIDGVAGTIGLVSKVAKPFIHVSVEAWNDLRHVHEADAFEGALGQGRFDEARRLLTAAEPGTQRHAALQRRLESRELRERAMQHYLSDDRASSSDSVSESTQEVVPLDIQNEEGASSLPPEQHALLGQVARYIAGNQPQSYSPAQRSVDEQVELLRQQQTDALSYVGDRLAHFITMLVIKSLLVSGDAAPEEGWLRESAGEAGEACEWEALPEPGSGSLFCCMRSAEAGLTDWLASSQIPPNEAPPAVEEGQFSPHCRSLFLKMLQDYQCGWLRLLVARCAYYVLLPILQHATHRVTEDIHRSLCHATVKDEGWPGFVRVLTGLVRVMREALQVLSAAYPSVEGPRPPAEVSESSSADPEPSSSALVASEEPHPNYTSFLHYCRERWISSLFCWSEQLSLIPPATSCPQEGRPENFWHWSRLHWVLHWARYLITVPFIWTAYQLLSAIESYCLNPLAARGATYCIDKFKVIERLQSIIGDMVGPDGNLKPSVNRSLLDIWERCRGLVRYQQDHPYPNPKELQRLRYLARKALPARDAHFESEVKELARTFLGVLQQSSSLPTCVTLSLTKWFDQIVEGAGEGGAALLELMARDQSLRIMVPTNLINAVARGLFQPSPRPNLATAEVDEQAQTSSRESLLLETAQWATKAWLNHRNGAALRHLRQEFTAFYRRALEPLQFLSFPEVSGHAALRFDLWAISPSEERSEQHQRAHLLYQALHEVYQSRSPKEQAEGWQASGRDLQRHLHHWMVQHSAENLAIESTAHHLQEASAEWRRLRLSERYEELTRQLTVLQGWLQFESLITHLDELHQYWPPSPQGRPSQSNLLHQQFLACIAQSQQQLLFVKSLFPGGNPMFSWAQEAYTAIGQLKGTATSLRQTLIEHHRQAARTTSTLRTASDVLQVIQTTYRELPEQATALSMEAQLEISTKLSRLTKQVLVRVQLMSPSNAQRALCDELTDFARLCMPSLVSSRGDINQREWPASRRSVAKMMRQAEELRALSQKAHAEAQRKGRHLALAAATLTTSITHALLPNPATLNFLWDQRHLQPSLIDTVRRTTIATKLREQLLLALHDPNQCDPGLIRGAIPPAPIASADDQGQGVELAQPPSPSNGPAPAQLILPPWCHEMPDVPPNEWKAPDQWLQWAQGALALFDAEPAVEEGTTLDPRVEFLLSSLRECAQRPHDHALWAELLAMLSTDLAQPFLLLLDRSCALAPGLTGEASRHAALQDAIALRLQSLLAEDPWLEQLSFLQMVMGQYRTRIIQSWHQHHTRCSIEELLIDSPPVVRQIPQFFFERVLGVGQINNSLWHLLAQPLLIQKAITLLLQRVGQSHERGQRRDNPLPIEPSPEVAPPAVQEIPASAPPATRSKEELEVTCSALVAALTNLNLDEQLRGIIRDGVPASALKGRIQWACTIWHRSADPTLAAPEQTSIRQQALRELTEVMQSLLSDHSPTRPLQPQLVALSKALTELISPEAPAQRP